jgi:hypothetical protein
MQEGVEMTSLFNGLEAREVWAGAGMLKIFFVKKSFKPQSSRHRPLPNTSFKCISVMGLLQCYRLKGKTGGLEYHLGKHFSRGKQMEEKIRGEKYMCFQCGCKFYDMGKAQPICPKCGVNQNESPQAKKKKKEEKSV